MRVRVYQSGTNYPVEVESLRPDIPDLDGLVFPYVRYETTLCNNSRIGNDYSRVRQEYPASKNHFHF